MPNIFKQGRPPRTKRVLYSSGFIIATLLAAFSLFSHYNVTSAEVGCVTPPSNLVSWWPGDGDANDIQDGNSGTLMNGATFATGKVGQAFSFDGAGAYVSVPDSANLDITSEITIDAWINIPAYTYHQAIVTKGSDGTYWGYLLQFDWWGGNNLGFFTDASGWHFTNSPIPTGQLVHVAVTYDGSYKKFYINGVLDASYPATGAIYATTAPLRIGARSDGFYFNGLLDEVEVFNRALSASEIATIYDANSAGMCKPVCGDGIIEGAECEDGNTTSGDGCSAVCAVESGWRCAGLPSVCALIPCATPPSNLVSWWPGDGDANDIWDANPGTLNNGATFATGKVGQAFSFDGADDYVEISDSASLRPANALTVETWAKIDALPDGVGAHLVDKNTLEPGWYGYEGYLLAVGGSASFTVVTTNGYFMAIGNTNIVDGQPHLLAGTYDGTSVKIYVDGVLQASTPASGSIVYSNSLPLVLGANHPSSPYTRRLKGFLDEVEIFNRALSASEITAIYDANSAGMCKALAITTTELPDSVVGYFASHQIETALGTPPLTFSVASGSLPPGTSLSTSGVLSGTPTTAGTYNFTVQVTDVTGTTTTKTLSKKVFTCTAPPSNLVSWWPGDGDANDIWDANPGTLNNGATFATGKVGQAFSFDGADDYVEVPASGNLGISSALTIDAWVKPDALTNYAGVVSKNIAGLGEQYTYMAVVHGDGAIGMYSPSSDWQFSSSGVVPAGTWSHVAWVWSGTTVTFYVNGAAVGSQPMVILNNYPQHTVKFGKWYTAQGIYTFDGLLDEVKIFNRALSASEITAIYDANSAGMCKPVCGDGIIEGAECEDGNTSSGDGCSAVCAVESGWRCAGLPSVCTFGAITCSGSQGTPTAVDEASLAGRDITFSGSGWCILDNSFSAASVIVSSGTHLTHATGDTNGINISTTGIFNLQAEGTIDVIGKGNGPGGGPGAGGWGVYDDYNTGGGGGGYGGNGGKGGRIAGGAGGGTYGSESAPADLGSGGGGTYYQSNNGGAGGGRIKLDVSGVLTVNGTITADGGAAPHSGGGPGGGGGSGGSVWLESGSITGSGAITAKGGNGGNNSGYKGGGGGGGGGRILFSTILLTNSGTVSAEGGLGQGGWSPENGSAGTIIGYTPSVADMDGDGVTDAMDRCPNTDPADTSPFEPATGCKQSQVDSNLDGFCNQGLTFVTSLCAPVCLAPPSNLVSWWPGDGSAEDIWDGNPGTLQGGATATAAGKVGQAFSFDGADDYVSVPDNDAWDFTSHDGTIDFWLKVNSMPSVASGLITQINNDDNWAVYYYSDGKIAVGHGGVNEFTSAGGVISAGVWYHVAVVKSGSTTIIYVNGNQVASATTPVWTSSPNPLRIGGHTHRSIGYYHNGTIDEVEIYNRALSATEIQAIFNANSGGMCKVPSDTEPPETAITSAVDGNGNAVVNGGSTASNSITFTFTGTDNIEAVGFECQLNGGAFEACASPKTYTGLVEGARVFSVRAKDAANNIDPTPAGHNWTVDITAPAVISVTLTPSIVGTTAEITITKIVTDATAVASVGATIEGPAPSSNPIGAVNLSLIAGTPQNGTWSGSFSFPAQAQAPDGTYTIVNSESDTLGNFAITADGTVILDRTSPTVVITSPADGALTSASAVPVSGNVSDNLGGSGLASVNINGVGCSFGAGVFSCAGVPLVEGLNTLTATVADNAGNLAIYSITVRRNVAPVAVPDSYQTNEDTTLNISAPGVLGNDSDSDGDALSATAVAAPSHGILTLNFDGSFTYTPSANYNGADSFTYKAVDSSLAESAPVTVSLTINPVNDAPVAVADSYAMDEDTILTIVASGVLENDTDVENNPLSAVLVGGPSHGALILNSNGSFAYTPASDYFGSDSFTYRANDGLANSNTATVTITINDMPEIITVSGGTLVGQVTNLDGSITYTILGNSGNTFKATLPAGTIPRPPATSIVFTIKDLSKKPAFSVEDAQLPSGSTESMQTPRPSGKSGEKLCVKDVAGAAFLDANRTCPAKPGEGTINLSGASGSFNFTLSDSIVRTVTYTSSFITVSGMRYSLLEFIGDADDDGVLDDEDQCRDLAGLPEWQGCPSAVRVSFLRHTVQSGTKPGSTKAPVVGATIKAFDASDGSCAKNIGLTPHKYQTVYQTCAAFNSVLTDSQGIAPVGVAPGGYLMISQDPVTSVFAGVPSGSVASSQLVNKFIQVIVTADGSSVSAKTTTKTGSLLHIIEPEYIEWDSAQEYYPYVFDSEGDWNIMVTIYPPEGFIADQESLSEDVNSEYKALQFILTDVGSCWECGADVEFAVTHKGKKELIKSHIATGMTEDFIKLKGLNPHELAAEGVIIKKDNAGKKISEKAKK